MRRSHSKSALFNEDVLEVSLLKSPARKTCFRTPYQSGVQGGLSDGVQALLIAQQSRPVTIYDRLQLCNFVVNVTHTHTVEYLKTRIQSKQGSDGLGIIPAHIQVLYFNGRQCQDDETVWSILSELPHQDAWFVVEPRVNELVSFFLASVSDLSGQGLKRKPEVQLSPTTSCADAAFGQAVTHLSLNDHYGTDFFGEGMEGVEAEIARSPSTPSSPRSVASPGAPLSPMMTASFGSPPTHLMLEHGTPRESRYSYRGLRVEVGSPEMLSSKTTPTGDRCEDMGVLGMSSPGGMEAVAYSFDGSFSSVGEMMQCRGGLVVTNFSPPVDGAELDILPLRKIEKSNYTSQSHILFRGDRHACLQQLPWPKLEAMQKLVLEVQSGLRHGHVPEELSTSGRDSLGRDSLSMQQSIVDSLELDKTKPVTDFDYGELVQNCCGGTYMMRNSRGAQSAVFKPMDEEPYAPENPKGFIGQMDVESGMKAGVTVGGGAARECAAFLLDHNGLGGVPCTTMLRIAHTTLVATDCGSEDRRAEVQIKVGSLQGFQQHDCTAEDVGTSRFDLEQLHAIGVFDIRTFNMDRNSDNILVKMACSSASVELVPIDHGYILPSYKHLEDVHACWLHWPQAKVAYSESMLEYIASLDAQADMDLLRSTLGLPEDCLLTLFIGTTLMQVCADQGLTLHETGMLMVREASDSPSAVELVVAKAIERTEREGYDACGTCIMCQDFYGAIKMHLQELIWGLVTAHQNE